MNFQDLNLDPRILQAIDELDYKTPTDIQQIAIPQILNGVDIYASAQTGTGKTASFLLPALQLLTTPSTSKGFGPRILILVPTRELAMQVSQEAIKYSKHLSRVKTVCIYGGESYIKQNKELSRPYEILVATPGRLIDHLERGRIQFSRIQMFILDEADRMLDMGFIKPVEQIAEALPAQRQTLLFSATLGGSVLRLAKSLLNQPIQIKISSEQAKHENIDQRLLFVSNIHDKHLALDYFLEDLAINQAIIFTSTKRQADQLLQNLLDRGHQAAALHGDMNQHQRLRTIGRVIRGEVRTLVATDIAARGIDVRTISHVINFDLPISAEDYVHRIGRTGRAGAKGIAVSFAAPKDMKVLQEIEQFTGHKLIVQTIPGLDVQPQPLFKASRGTAKRTKPNVRRPRRRSF
jgi:superfamily II DNA/RNA helicase